MPEDIPEDPSMVLPESPPNKDAAMSENGGGPYRIDFLVALISGVFPWGWSVSGLAPNIVLACVCWGISLFALLHFFWNWSGNTGRLKIVRLPITLGLPVLLLSIAWKPVEDQYRIQHSIADDLSPRFEVSMNEFTNQITNGAVFETSVGKGNIFWVRNTGSNIANNLTVEVLAPLLPSDVTSTGWEIEPPMMNAATMRFMTNRTQWLMKKDPPNLIGHDLAGWGTAPLIFSTNVHNSVFRRKQLEEMDFTMRGESLPYDFIVVGLPIELIISSDSGGFKKLVFFLSVKQ